MPIEPATLTDRQRELWRSQGQEIARARHAAGQTQPQFAARVGTSLATLRAWERGVRQPGLAHRRTLAALGARLDTAESCPHCGRPWG